MSWWPDQFVPTQAAVDRGPAYFPPESGGTKGWSVEKPTVTKDGDRGDHSSFRCVCGKLARVDKAAETRHRILLGESDANIDFDDLRRMLLWLGFDERVRGSHHIFRKQGVRELVNLQKEGNKA